MTDLLIEAPSDTPKIVDTEIIDVLPTAEVPVAASVQKGDTLIEQKIHRRCFERWLFLNQTTKLRAGQIDEQVAEEWKIQISTLRKWKAHFGWVQKLKEIKEVEAVEDNIKLYLKNDTIEHEALDLILRYIDLVKAGDIKGIDINMMKGLVEFAKKNKSSMTPQERTTMQAGNTNVSFVITG
jgi:hypothetical protein